MVRQRPRPERPHLCERFVQRLEPLVLQLERVLPRHDVGLLEPGMQFG